MSDDLVKRWDNYVESMGCVMGEVEHTAQQMRDRIEELEAKLEKAVEDFTEIARQKKTTEFETEYDVEIADFECGYDMCIARARTTLAELKGQEDE